MKQINQLEWKLQAMCVEWYRIQYPTKIIYASNNGVRVSIGAAVKMKRTGMLKSMPDLCVPHSFGGFHSLYIEMKRLGHKASVDQYSMMTVLKSCGHACIVCDNFDGFRAWVEWYFNLKASTHEMFLVQGRLKKGR